jgi:type IV pilus assembly protein PilA
MKIMTGKLSERCRRVLAARASAEEMAEGGFTLIELMVVLLIMGILLAIAIPTFLSVTKNANDKGAQSNLNAAVTAATSFYINPQNFSTFKTGNAGTNAIKFIAGGPALASSDQVAYALGTSTPTQSILFATWSASGVCWYALINKGSAKDSFGQVPGTYYGAAKASTASDCDITAGAAPTLSSSGWQTNFSGITGMP